MKTIEQRWKEFRIRVIHPDAPEMQLKEMRIAFFGGFKAMLDMNLAFAMLTEVEIAAALMELNTEAVRFGTSFNLGDNDDCA